MIKVKTQPWSWDDEDGCSDYGIHVWIDDVLVTDYGQDTGNLLHDVIAHLTGKEVKVYGYADKASPVTEGEDWEWVL